MQVMIDDVQSTMTDAAVLLGRIQMTESGLYRVQRRKGGATCNSCGACHFFVSQIESERELQRKKQERFEQHSDYVAIYKDILDVSKTVAPIFELEIYYHSRMNKILMFYSFDFVFFVFEKNFY